MGARIVPVTGDPIDGGTIVIDGALILMADGVLRDPVRGRIQDGMAVAIEGPEAVVLREMM